MRVNFTDRLRTVADLPIDLPADVLALIRSYETERAAAADLIEAHQRIPKPPKNTPDAPITIQPTSIGTNFTDSEAGIILSVRQGHKRSQITLDLVRALPMVFEAVEKAVDRARIVRAKRAKPIGAPDGIWEETIDAERD